MKPEIETLLRHVAAKLVYWSVNWDIEAYDLTGEERAFLAYEILAVSQKRWGKS